MFSEKASFINAARQIDNLRNSALEEVLRICTCNEQNNFLYRAFSAFIIAPDRIHVDAHIYLIRRSIMIYLEIYWEMIYCQFRCKICRVCITKWLKTNFRVKFSIRAKEQPKNCSKITYLHKWLLLFGFFFFSFFRFA